MTSDRPLIPDFAALDGSADPGRCVRYLDAVGGLGPVAAWKHETFALLEPRPGAALLDVGCGTGDDVCALAALVAPGGRAVGVDASRHMIGEARRRVGGTPLPAAFELGDARALPFGDATFDGARAERVLQHLPDPASAIAEMARVVRAGGRLVLSEPDWGTLVVDGPDPGLTARILSSAVRRNPSADAGRRLHGLLRAAGCGEISTRGRTLVMTDGAAADEVFELSALAEFAALEGEVAPAEADAWRAQLAARRDRVFAALTGFVAVARAPGG